jgi:hypothetical protein
MSFQDVGAKRRTTSTCASRQASHSPVVGPLTPSCTNQGDSLQHTSSDTIDFSCISAAFLRFQREVGNLPSAVHCKTSTNRHDLEKLQRRFNEASGLGENIKKLLQVAEDKLQLVPRARSSESRTRLVKLVRDFGRLEAMLKTVELDFKKKYPAGGQQKYSGREESTHHNRDSVVNNQLQLRMEEEDKFAEEIMRQREVEVSEINKKMHQVNAIYKVRHWSFLRQYFSVHFYWLKFMHATARTDRILGKL